mmetsp:Transcript_15993/g.37705  ORF Transcript_15993/g.37705 Transcript_15993/m.37705 type:complete len:304 (+) Transcript_15993:444-1355(+)
MSPAVSPRRWLTCRQSRGCVPGWTCIRQCRNGGHEIPSSYQALSLLSSSRGMMHRLSISMSILLVSQSHRNLTAVGLQLQQRRMLQQRSKRVLKQRRQPLLLMRSGGDRKRPIAHGGRMKNAKRSRGFRKSLIGPDGNAKMTSWQGGAARMRIASAAGSTVRGLETPIASGDSMTRTPESESESGRGRDNVKERKIKESCAAGRKRIGMSCRRPEKGDTLRRVATLLHEKIGTGMKVHSDEQHPRSMTTSVRHPSLVSLLATRLSTPWRNLPPKHMLHSGNLLALVGACLRGRIAFISGPKHP